MLVRASRDGLPAVRMGPWEGAALFGLAALLVLFGALPGPVMEPIGHAMADLFNLGEPAVMVAALP